MLLMEYNIKCMHSNISTLTSKYFSNVPELSLRYFIYEILKVKLKSVENKKGGN